VVQGGSGWLRVAQGDIWQMEGAQMVAQGGSGPFGAAQGDSGRLRAAWGDSERLRAAWGGSRRLRVAPGGLWRFQMGRVCSGWLRVVQGSSGQLGATC
jgi:hypothetical protein